jgi:hypothetical protein
MNKSAWNKGLKGWTNSGSFQKGHSVNAKTKQAVSRTQAGNTYRKGITLSLQTKNKLREANLGKTVSPEVRAKISQNNARSMLGRTGKLAPGWKGGISTQSKLYRNKFSRQIAKQVLKRDNYTCQMCNATKDLQVDHIQPWAEYVELRFNMDNCRTLCMKCHYKVTFGKEMPAHIKTWGTAKRFLKGEIDGN